MWSRVDTGLYPEIEGAIEEWFPGDDRVRAAAVAAWTVVMRRVPDRATDRPADLDTLAGLHAALSRVLQEEETKDQGDAWQRGYQAGIAYCRGRVAGMIEPIRSR